MSKGRCFSISCSSFTVGQKHSVRPLSFLHHSTFGVRYSAVLFRFCRLQQPNDTFRAAIRYRVTSLVVDRSSGELALLASWPCPMPISSGPPSWRFCLAWISRREIRFDSKYIPNR
jgi:hypothetical protein